jgi:large subunit ribosomal protein L6
MSRIGKNPIIIPNGVEVTISGNTIIAKGSLGQETLTLKSEIIIEREGNTIFVKRANESREARCLHGLSRTLLNNMIMGVNTGFEKKLEIVGVGYRAAKSGNDLDLQLGYSHPVKVIAPEGIEFILEGNTKVTVKGRNKQTVGDVAAEVRSKRPPEVYKGKGVKYAGEYIRRKAGKAGKK